MTAEIRLDEVTVTFGRTMALRSVSCCMRPGITLLQGPNGAGKSTLLGVAAGLVRPRRGRVRVLGFDPAREPAVHRALGVAPQLAPPPPQLRPLELVVGAARRSLSGRDARSAASELLADLGVDPHDDRRLGRCPPDVVRLVVVAAALVGDPAVLVLDEPLAELSLAQRRALVGRLAATSRGQVVVVSSHVVDDLAPVLDEVVTLEHGRMARPAVGADLGADPHPSRAVGP